MAVYDQKPERFLTRLYANKANPHPELFCAGFELGAWRCQQFAFHLAEWLPDYALPEEELKVDHGNILTKLNQAAIRVYTSDKYKARGEAGEIALHAICRDYFGTIPISPRVFYKSATNDVIKAFDMVHVRFGKENKISIWLGESKIYKDGGRAVADAIKSIRQHIEAGFLSNQKMLLGPQIPKSTPRYNEIMNLFKKQESLDTLLAQAVFVVGIICESGAISTAKAHDAPYVAAATAELQVMEAKLKASGLHANLKLGLFYIPVPNKKLFVDAFDKRLKGLQ